MVTYEWAWAWTTSLPRDKSPHSLCWAHHLSLLQTQRVLLALLQHRCQWPSGMTPAFCISDPIGGVGVLPLQHQVGCIPASEWSHWPRGANASQGTGSCALSLLLLSCYKDTRYHVSLGRCRLFSATSLISSLGDIIIKWKLQTIACDWKKKNPKNLLITHINAYNKEPMEKNHTHKWNSWAKLTHT